jgi:hypothetical protein
MSTNHTMLTIGAFTILMTILQNFYGLLGTTGGDITDAQDMILATTLATSYLESAQGLSFDAETDTTNMALGNPDLLTSPSLLGPEDAGEDSIHKFNDFDDFDGYSIERESGATGRRFRTTFTVSYVNPASVNSISTSRTFVKRIDVKSWRSFPPPSGTTLDTLRMSMVMGYFHFD